MEKSIQHEMETGFTGFVLGFVGMFQWWPKQLDQSFGDKDITAEPDPVGNIVADSPLFDCCATSARAPVLSVSEP